MEQTNLNTLAKLSPTITETPCQKPEIELSSHERNRLKFFLLINLLFVSSFIMMTFTDEKSDFLKASLLFSAIVTCLVLCLFFFITTKGQHFLIGWLIVILLNSTAACLLISFETYNEEESLTEPQNAVFFIFLNILIALQTSIKRINVALLLIILLELACMAITFIWLMKVGCYKKIFFYSTAFLCLLFETIHQAVFKKETKTKNAEKRSIKALDEFPSGIFNDSRLEPNNILKTILENHQFSEKLKHANLLSELCVEEIDLWKKITINLNGEFEAKECSITEALISVEDNLTHSLKSIGTCRINQNTYLVLVKKVETNKLHFVFVETPEIQALERQLDLEELKKLKLTKLVHEFKTPLISILCISEQLIEDDKFQSNNTIKSLKSLSSYLSYLAFFLQKYTQKYMKNKQAGEINNLYNPFKTKFKLSELIEFCSVVLNSLLSANSIKSQTIVTETKFLDMPINFMICSDRNLILQILLNLISNAVKFTKAGKISINCKFHHEENNEKLVISVSDTGEGVSESKKKLLFGNFCKLDNSKENENGTGLGLSVSLEIAQKLGFLLEFETEEAIGSTVSLVIPRKNSEEKCINFDFFNQRKETVPLRRNAMIDQVEVTPHLPTYGKIRYSIKSSSLKNRYPLLNSDSEMVNEFKCNDENNSFNFKSMFDSERESERDSSEDSYTVTVENDIPCPNKNELLKMQEMKLSISPQNNKRTLSKFKKSRTTERQIILIIDDSDCMRKSLEKMLVSVLTESENYEVLHGRDGIDLLKHVFDAYLTKKKIVTVFLDINMEFLQGDRAVSILKETQLEVPQIIYTSEDASHEQNFISKPPNKRELIQVLLSIGLK